MKKLFIVFFISIMFTTIAFAGSGKEKSGALTIGFSISTLNNPFFVTLEEGANELGLEIVVLDAQDNPSK